jgi:tripartite-type tricarboxylate transporter receptor subunit TctC
MNTERLLRSFACAAAALLLCCGLGQAEDWPNKPLTMIIPLPAGGATDAVLRLVAREMSGTFGQQVVVENRTGAAGRIGLSALARAPKDGYTFGAVTSGPLIAVPASSKVVPYDPIKDFTQLALLYEVYTTLLMSPTVPVNSVKELVAYAKANPGRLNYGSIGNGSVAHFITEHWRRSVDMQLEHIPYKGEPQAVQDLLVGRLQLYISPAPYLDFVGSGRLKALATTGPKRPSMQPEIPTMDELGYPEASMSVLFGLAGPANLPAEIAQRLTSAALLAIRTPALRQRLNDSGYILRAEGASEMAAMVQADLARFRRIAMEAGISVDQ